MNNTNKNSKSNRAHASTSPGGTVPGETNANSYMKRSQTTNWGFTTVNSIPMDMRSNLADPTAYIPMNPRMNLIQIAIKISASKNGGL